MFYHIEKDEKKIVLQYLMLSQSVFHWQFLFTYMLHHGSVGSMLHRGSVGSMLHHGSVGSMLHHGSVGSMLHHGSVGSMLHHGSVGSMLHHGPVGRMLHHGSVGSMLHHGSVGQVHSKKCYFMFAYTFETVFCCFSSKNLCSYHFHFFFWWSIKFPPQNINQSETWTDDKKLSVELYV